MQPRQPIQPKKVYGDRYLAREKAMQVLVAHDISGEDWETLFAHIAHVSYKIEEEVPDRLLTKKEVEALESDDQIVWDGEDLAFMRNLVEATIRNADESNELIQRFSSNWTIDRIAVIDRVIIKMAIAELLEFDDIPPKVTLDQALNVAKKFSTEKSQVFVNGVLDSVLVALRDAGRIVKRGRGLIDESIN